MEEQILTKKQRRQLKKEQEHQQRLMELKKKKSKKFFIWALTFLAVIFGGYFLSLIISSVKVLPPTTIQGHVEISPPSHIVTEPIHENIQKHMLEHADGSGPSGIIIHYNCEKFSCEDDLINKLTAIVQEYPANVYLAPGPRYDGKIILTKLNKQKILSEFNEEAIRDFIK